MEYCTESCWDIYYIYVLFSSCLLLFSLCFDCKVHVEGWIRQSLKPEMKQSTMTKIQQPVRGSFSLHIICTDRCFLLRLLITHLFGMLPLITYHLLVCAMNRM